MPEYPNILMILTDDQGEWAMGCSGNDEIITPNLDSLAEEGTRFTNFFCASPVCSPARASILTGMIPSQHGVHDWIRGGNVEDDSYDGAPVQYLEGYPTYSEKLSEMGYTCGMTGKWHLGDSQSPQHGFDHWHVIERGGSNYYDATFIDNGTVKHSTEYITDTITNDAIQFIETHSASDSPFYLSVHYTAPHDPWGRDQHPEEVFALYDHCAFDSVPNEPVHTWQINSCDAGYNQTTRRELLAGYFAAVTAMDAGVGRILETLDRLGIREDTLVVFTSDNGMSMGHHGIWGKGNGTYPQNMYDQAIKVPTIISKRGELPESAVDDHLLSHYDLRPTLLEYLGQQSEAEHLPGRSFLPALRGEDLEETHGIVIYDEYGPVRMLRTREWKLVIRHRDGPNELFDLADDPGELTNLYDHPDHAAIQSELAAQLSTWFEKYSDPIMEGIYHRVTGMGQMTRLMAYGMRKKFADNYFFTARLYKILAFLMRLVGKR